VNRFLLFVPLAALAILVVAAAFLLTRESEREYFSDGRIGRAAPDYALTSLDGESTVTKEAFGGRAYVVNVFASWCTPCRAEHPQLMALQASGVQILGVAYKDRPEASAAFLSGLGDPFTVVGQDPEGRFALELGIIGVPETFVIGADGAIRAVHRGPLTAEVLEETIRPALEVR
jgi:cytochrome c biogenesis protein CcmG/thiol:disulfide interchange protein DsbE